ncbi:MAG: MATE family efflux transporter [candidate division KSB1 bacterium]|nr:MATE family efflux transporter [candidate division KSB1 bacterium]MDZ7336718.1 MATE family efflux transporter [candidate division KSB1 bacterium]MDZ7356711.1 MATE family efflux transporter [candidate division KSB1 bacterium]MDZ7398621.1 MATE family efflux transporter [candidate division KSB1 bacterium]
MSKLITPIYRRWDASNGYRDVLKLAFPLILSTASSTIQQFIDRMFLTWHSPAAIAAAATAGIVSFTLQTVFIGTAAYVNTFVAQYFGAKQYDRIASAVWQGIYFSLIAGLVILGLIPLARPIFNLAGHAPEMKALEIEYFTILCFGGLPVFILAAVSGFFGGRGETRVIMWANVIATAINIVFDYLLIFGHCGFPQLGIKGAAIATVMAGYSAAIIITFYMFKARYRHQFLTLKNHRFDWPLFKRLMQFGLPNGFHFMLDLLGFTLFVLLVGRLGTLELAATSITFNINHIAFMPMIGIGMAVEIIVGQRLGENQPQQARFGTYSALHLTFLYMITIALTYVLFPKIYLWPFAAQSDPAQFTIIQNMAIVLLHFVAFYCIFDTLNIVFASALKGAGDTQWVMITSVLLSWTTLVVPTFFACVVYRWGLYIAWGFVTLYITLLGIAFTVRFLGGKWESMRVIEQAELHRLEQDQQVAL